MSPITITESTTATRQNCLEEGTLYKPVTSNQESHVQLKKMAALTKEMGSISITECQSQCQSTPSCAHLTFHVVKGYCLLLTREMLFEKIKSSQFMSGSKEKCDKKDVQLKNSLNASTSSDLNFKAQETPISMEHNHVLM